MFYTGKFYILKVCPGVPTKAFRTLNCPFFLKKKLKIIHPYKNEWKKNIAAILNDKDTSNFSHRLNIGTGYLY